MNPEDLRSKYRDERLKRLRADGNDQYLEASGKFATMEADPYVEWTERPAQQREVAVVIIGAGFAGLLAGARLREVGVDDLCLIDGAGDVGGVWYWNRYPGAACDTAAMIYLPLLEETGYMPSAKYVEGPEIYEHAQRIADHFHLKDGALFSTEVEAMVWDEVRQQWVVTTNRGDTICATFVVAGTGPLHRPKLPGVPGIERFRGESFHTSRWNYAVTGGDPNGAPMDRLRNLRVGLLGTGATGVQVVPKLGRDAGELFVFQRTPSSIDVRNNTPIDREWFSSLEDGWQQEWLTNFATLQTGGEADIDLVQDGWTDIALRIRKRAFDLFAAGIASDVVLRQAYEESDDEKMNEIRERVDHEVHDALTAEALKPWYRQLCKRPCFHDGYLQTFNLPNVHLIDTNGAGVSEIDETGVVVRERHVALDVLIFASGFEVGTSWVRRSGFDPIGVGGETLAEHWRDGMVSLHGMHVSGFPNFFIMGLAQAGNLVSNITHNFSESAKTIATVIQHARSTGATRVETNPLAEQAWVDSLGDGRSSFMFDPDCTPGYYNNEGLEVSLADQKGRIGYPLGAVAFFDLMSKWRSSGAFEGLAFSS